MQIGSSPPSQVQPYWGHTGVHKSKHIILYPHKHNWSVVALRLQHTDSPLSPEIPAKPQRGDQLLCGSPWRSRHWMLLRTSGLQACHPFTLPARTHSPPGGAGLRWERVWSLPNDPRSWQREAGRSWRGGGGLNPRIPPGPVAWSPWRPRSSRSLGRTTWISREQKAAAWLLWGPSLRRSLRTEWSDPRRLLLAGPARRPSRTTGQGNATASWPPRLRQGHL